MSPERDELVELSNELSGAVRRLLDRTGDLIRPGGLMTALGDDPHARLRREAVLAVYRWPQWQQAMSRASGGYLRSPRRVARWRSADDEGPFDPDADTSTPLRPRFDDAFATLHAYAWRLVREAVAGWTERAAASLAPVRARLLDERTQSLLAGLLPYLDEDGGVARLARLRRLVELDWVDDELTAVIDAADRVTGDGAHLFPFKERHALPWHPHRRREAHQVQLFRLRASAVDALADALSARMSLALTELYGRLNSRLHALGQAVPTALHVHQVMP